MRAVVAGCLISLAGFGCSPSPVEDVQTYSQTDTTGVEEGSATPDELREIVGPIARSGAVDSSASAIPELIAGQPSSVFSAEQKATLQERAAAILEERPSAKADAQAILDALPND